MMWEVAGFTVYASCQMPTALPARRGIAMNTGSQQRTCQIELIRIPIRKTTVPSGKPARYRPGWTRFDRSAMRVTFPMQTRNRGTKRDVAGLEELPGQIKHGHREDNAAGDGHRRP